jgi:GNAT superfamily N-acetyltransferase
MEAIRALDGPDPFDKSHDCGSFCSGEPALDLWLGRRGLANQASGGSRTFVITENRRVVAYYALAAGSVEIRSAPGRFRRNMPDPVPVAVLGRLAVDVSWQGRGLGRALIWDAGRRVAHAAEVIGIRGILVHAISPTAAAFYKSVGFEPSLNDPQTLMITLTDVLAALED